MKAEVEIKLDRNFFATDDWFFFFKATVDVQTANYRLAMLVRWTRRWGVVLFRSCGTHVSVTERPPETQVSKTRRRIRFAVFCFKKKKTTVSANIAFSFTLLEMLKRR